MRIVGYYCPQHGWIVEASVHARVTCHCGQHCAPKGIDPKEHDKRVAAYRRVQRHRAGS